MLLLPSHLLLFTRWQGTPLSSLHQSKTWISDWGSHPAPSMGGSVAIPNSSLFPKP